MTTDLYRQMLATESAWGASKMDLAKLNSADVASALYVSAVGAARKEWKAVPEGEAKDSAENNAFDTEGCREDALRWYQIAAATYQMNVDSGEYAS